MTAERTDTESITIKDQSILTNDGNSDRNEAIESKIVSELVTYYGDEIKRFREAVTEGEKGATATPSIEKNDSIEIPIEEENIVQDITDSRVLQKQSNTYYAKKTVAQGMMDIALITANANQLRYIIEFNQSSSTFYLNLVLITVSLLLQIAIGVSLIFKGRMDLRGESKHHNAKRIDNYVVVGVFLVTIINVFIASFTITDTDNK